AARPPKCVAEKPPEQVAQISRGLTFGFIDPIESSSYPVCPFHKCSPCRPSRPPWIRALVPAASIVLNCSEVCSRPIGSSLPFKACAMFPQSCAHLRTARNCGESLNIFLDPDRRRSSRRALAGTPWSALEGGPSVLKVSQSV